MFVRQRRDCRTQSNDRPRATSPARYRRRRAQASSARYRARLLIDQGSISSASGPHVVRMSGPHQLRQSLQFHWLLSPLFALVLMVRMVLMNIYSRLYISRVSALEMHADHAGLMRTKPPTLDFMRTGPCAGGARRTFACAFRLSVGELFQLGQGTPSGVCPRIG
jgi:hypothetical protein